MAVYRGPRSYTGEDGAEITCHGSLPVIRRILSLLARSGFRAAGPGEFTQRAFLNGRMDLTRAEAVNEIVRARTDRARALALQRLSGAIQRKIEAVRDDLIGVQAALEASLDYPDDDHGASVDTAILDRAASTLEALARTCARGRLYQEGVAVALAGATNAGKSSLFNQLLRQDRAIVSEVHGTTRDWLEAGIDRRGFPCACSTPRVPGSRATRSSARDSAARARCCEAPTWSCGSLTRGWVSPTPTGPAWRRPRRAGPGSSARGTRSISPGALPCPDGFVAVSALTGEGLERLEAAMAAALLAGTADAGDGPLLDSERQRELLERALGALARFRDDLGPGPAARRPRGRPARGAGRPRRHHRRGDERGRARAPVLELLRGEVAAMDHEAIVVGAGHAGIEAGLALARVGLDTLLVTQSLDAIGRMSCNPAIGGLAKGNLVREIDALGGEMGRLVDAAMIQFRMLNTSRGPAVQAPRAQEDKQAYAALAKRALERQPGLGLLQDTVVDLVLDARRSAHRGRRDRARADASAPASWS